MKVGGGFVIRAGANALYNSVTGGSQSRSSAAISDVIAGSDSFWDYVESQFEDEDGGEGK
jgi:hypothetical protein